MIWSRINLLSEVPKQADLIFTGSKIEKRKKWEALNNFARQAEAYYRALELTKGTSRGLLGYYCSLNLAKAELLHHCPEKVIDTQIKHGISYRIGTSRTFAGDYITVQNSGVFPLLYEARTGVKLKSGTRVSIRKLLRQIPEVGQEYRDVFGERTNAIKGWCRVMIANGRCWVRLALAIPVLNFTETTDFTRITRHFDLVEPSPGWRQVFPMAGNMPSQLTLLESKKDYSLIDGDYLPMKDLWQLYTDCFGHTIEHPIHGNSDFTLCVRPHKRFSYTVPSFLARYLAMYYQSSLVRYQPSRLDPTKDRTTVWLLEAFARQSPECLLADGLDGITKQNNCFSS